MAWRRTPGCDTTTRCRAWVRGAHVLGLMTMLFILACEDNAPGIFHTLATESRRDNRNLHDDLTVSAVAAVHGYYYVAAHGLWGRPSERDSWQAVRRPRSGPTEVPVLGLAQHNDTLCVGTEDGVYYAEADPKSPSWRPASGISGQILRIFGVLSADGDAREILAITGQRGLYRSTDCVSFSPVNLPDGATATGRPFDAFHDGRSYWLTVGDRVYTGAALSRLTRDQGAPAEGQYRGILCLGGGRCLFATHDGKIYERNGAGWVLLGQIEPPDDDLQTLPLTLFTRIDDRILIGTRGYGFYQFDAGDEDLGNVRRGPRSTSQLYRAHITVFARHDDLVFAGTAGDGLSSIDVATARKDTGTWDWE